MKGRESCWHGTCCGRTKDLVDLFLGQVVLLGHVDLYVAFLCRSVVANGACERFVASMYPHMDLEEDDFLVRSDSYPKPSPGANKSIS